MTTTLRQSSWIITLSMAAMSIAYLTMVWLPGYRAIKEMREQVEAKRSFIAQATGVSAIVNNIQREIGQVESFANQWEKTAPKKRDIPQLYAKIDALAKDAHLAIGRFDPQPFILHEQIQEIPITMTCSGKFTDIHAFLRAMEKLPLTIWVELLRIEKDAKNTKDVQCELNLVVFSNNPHSSDYAKHSD
jgi:Tfp pilus assembly protein PilO